MSGFDLQPITSVIDDSGISLSVSFSNMHPHWMIISNICDQEFEFNIGCFVEKRYAYAANFYVTDKVLGACKKTKWCENDPVLESDEWSKDLICEICSELCWYCGKDIGNVEFTGTYGIRVDGEENKCPDCDLKDRDIEENYDH